MRTNLRKHGLGAVAMMLTVAACSDTNDLGLTEEDALLNADVAAYAAEAALDDNVGVLLDVPLCRRIVRERGPQDDEQNH